MVLEHPNRQPRRARLGRFVGRRLGVGVEAARQVGPRGQEGLQAIGQGEQDRVERAKKAPSANDTSKSSAAR
jgi:hypothetical protein